MAKIPPPPQAITGPPAIDQAILTIRGHQVMIDADLATLYGVETRVLNQAVKRNPGRFPEGFRFELTAEEKREVITRCGHLERLKYAPSNPNAFTEHGVLMAATVLSSDRAVAVSIAIIEAFIRLREAAMATADGGPDPRRLPVRSRTSGRPGPIQQRIDAFLGDVGPRLETAVNAVLDTVANPREGTTVREEAHDLIAESIAHLKSKLRQAGLENEEIAARITRLLAEAEHDRSQARRARAEAEQLELSTLVRRLRLVLAAQRTLTFGEVDPDDPLMARIDAFERTLGELAGDR